MSDAEKARLERDKLRQREQERRRREAQVCKKYFNVKKKHILILSFISAKPNRHEQTIGNDGSL